MALKFWAWDILYWKISVIWVYCHLKFSGTGVCCYTEGSGNGCSMKVQLGNFSSNTCSVSGQTDLKHFFVLKNVLRAASPSNGHLGPTFSFPALNFLIPLTSNCCCYLFKTLGLGINILHKFWDWLLISDQISGIGS